MDLLTFATPLLVRNEEARKSRLQISMLTEDRVNGWRVSAGHVRCPFLRRRAGEGIDAVVLIATWLSSRHKKLDLRPLQVNKTAKLCHLQDEQLLEILRQDFEERNYYVTGKLSTRIYADNCFFDSPDPDLPVADLRKYIDAASNLFDRKLSKCELFSIKIVEPRKIVADWRLEGALLLPWKPTVKAFLGRTAFHLNEEGLVHRHEEQWSISALDAFVSTLLLKNFGEPPAASAGVIRDNPEWHFRRFSP